MANSNQQKRGGIYVRLSHASDDQMKLSDQLEMCRKLAADNGVEVVEVYEDDGISAFTGKDRPGWNQMLLDVQAGKFDVLFAQSEDRFARQVADKETLAVLCVAGGVTWLTINDGATDPSTADGEFFSVLRAGLSRMESRRKAERQVQRNAAMRARGELPRGGKRPFGYTAEGSPHPVEAEHVRWAYDRCLSAEGTGLSAIRTEFNGFGLTSVNGNPFDLPKVEKILRRARNAGLVEHRVKGTTWPQLVLDGDGNPVRGKWEAIVPEDTFFAVVAKLDNPNRRLHAPRPAQHLLSSIARCVCGVKLRVAGRTNDIAVYRCGVHDGAAHKIPKLRHVSVRCDELDALVVRQVVHAMVLSPRRWMPDPAADRLAQLHTALTRARRAQQQAARLMTDPDLDHMLAVYKSEIMQHRAEEQRLQTEIDSIRQVNAQAALLHDLSATVFSTSGVVDMDAAAGQHDALVRRFGQLSLDDRRALVRAYVDVQVLNGRVLDRRVRVTHKITKCLNV